MDLSDVLYHDARGRSLRIPMPPHPIAAEQARTLAEMTLDDWDLGLLTENTLLVVSELVTNAVKQHDVFLFALHRCGNRAIIEVTDTSPGSSKVKKADATDINGRGLLLVEAISDKRGVRYEDDGRKTVWAIVAK